MGAEFNFLVIDTEKQSQVEKQFELLQRQDRYENGHSYSGGIGMADGIEFISKNVFKSIDEAREFLYSKCEKWEPALAVKFINKNGKTQYAIGALCSS